MNTCKEDTEAKLYDREDEAAVECRTTVAATAELARTMLEFVRSYAAAKAYGAHNLLRVHLDKPQVMSLFVSAEQALENPSFEDRIPMDMHELVLKSAVVTAFVEDNTQEIYRMLDLSGPDGLGRRLRRNTASCPSDGFMPERRLQKTIVSTLLLECVNGNQSFEFKKADIAKWLPGLLRGEIEMDIHLRQELDLVQWLLTRDVAEEEDDARQLDATVREIKACQSGPLFLFRMSKFGLKLLTTVSTQAMDSRSQMVFKRRRSQLDEDITKLVNNDVPKDHSAVAFVMSSVDDYKKVQEAAKFLESAPKAF